MTVKQAKTEAELIATVANLKDVGACLIFAERARAAGMPAQDELDDYIERFQNRDHYTRMIFAVHSPRGQLRHSEKNVQFWDGDRVAALAVRLGLGGWIETKLG